MAEANTQVRVCGFGGQGVVLAGTILGYAGVNDGKWVAGASSYGTAARGGSARCDVVLSDKPINYPHVILADVLIAMSQKAYDVYIKEVKPGSGIVIYDEQFVSVKEKDKIKQIGIPATAAAIKELNNRQVANIVILGGAVGLTNVVSRGALAKAIEENVSARFKDLNLKAAELGYKLGEEALAKMRAKD